MKKYVMITHWKDYWDGLENKEAHFAKSMLKEGMHEGLVDEWNETIFIKIKDERKKEFEGAWIGRAYGFRYEKYTIYFKVQIQRELAESEVPEEYRGKGSGWYILENGDIWPPFLTSLSFKRGEVFEAYVFSSGPSGEADGFFKIGNLAVIYSRKIGQQDQIVVKEVSVLDLMRIFRRRLLAPKLDEDTLKGWLERLGEGES